METNSLDTLRVYMVAEEISDMAWKVFHLIPRQYRRSTGEQFLDSADSVGANIAEGYGRYTFKQRIHFCRIARGSLYEARFWFRQLCKRFKIEENKQEQFLSMLKNEAYLINQYIRYLKSQQ